MSDESPFTEAAERPDGWWAVGPQCEVGPFEDEKRVRRFIAQSDPAYLREMLARSR